MKFTCYTQDIRDALKFAVKCAATKPIIQILSAVKLTAGDGNLTLETTDNTSAAQVAIPVKASGVAIVIGMIMVIISVAVKSCCVAVIISM